MRRWLIRISVVAIALVAAPGLASARQTDPTAAPTVSERGTLMAQVPEPDPAPLPPPPPPPPPPATTTASATTAAASATTCTASATTCTASATTCTASAATCTASAGSGEAGCEAPRKGQAEGGGEEGRGEQGRGERRRRRRAAAKKAAAKAASSEKQSDSDRVKGALLGGAVSTNAPLVGGAAEASGIERMLAILLYILLFSLPVLLMIAVLRSIVHNNVTYAYEDMRVPVALCGLLLLLIEGFMYLLLVR